MQTTTQTVTERRLSDEEVEVMVLKGLGLSEEKDCQIIRERDGMTIITTNVLVTEDIKVDEEIADPAVNIGNHMMPCTECDGLLDCCDCPDSAIKTGLRRI